MFLDKFLGALESNEATFKIAKEFYEEYQISFDQTLGGTILFTLSKHLFDDPNEILVVSVEELCAMILFSAKQYAEKMFNKTDI